MFCEAQQEVAALQSEMQGLARRLKHRMHVVEENRAELAALTGDMAHASDLLAVRLVLIWPELNGLQWILDEAYDSVRRMLFFRSNCHSGLKLGEL